MARANLLRCRMFDSDKQRQNVAEIHASEKFFYFL